MNTRVLRDLFIILAIAGFFALVAGARAGSFLSTTLPPSGTLADGLVGHWTFDGKDTNWGTNKTNDRTSNANHGTITNMSTSTAPVAGRLGQGLRFDNNDYIECGTGSSLDITSAITLSAWIKLSKEDVFQGIVAKYDTEASNQKYILSVSNTNVVDLIVDSTVNRVSGLTEIAKNEWHHIAGTWDNVSQTMYVYLDGVQDPTTDTFAGPIGTTNRPCLIGWYWSNYPSFSPNKTESVIDDVRIYNRALTASEVKQLYEMGR